MLSRALLRLRDLGVSGGLLLLALFPLPATLWSLVGNFDPGLATRWPLLNVLLEATDPGAQQPLGRAMLRVVCAALAMAGLFLPARSDWRAPTWLNFGIPFLALGALSSILAPHRFQALREWEMWALCGAIVYTVASQWRPSWGAVALGWLYTLTMLFLVQALSLGFHENGVDRLGGPFKHPNAFSTFCLMALAVTMSRALSDGVDRRLAQLASGAWLGLALCAGSLTGGCLLVGALAAMVTAHSGRWSGISAILAALLLLILNLTGGWFSLLGLPLILVGLWLMALRRRPAQELLDRTWLIAVTAGLILLVSAVVAPGQLEGASAARRSSGQGRLQLYRTALAIALEHPVLGVGPAGFQREFPGRQKSLGVFSKFPHSLPLEIACEWGLPAALLLTLTVVGALRQAVGSKDLARVAGWVLTVFLLHSSTDVQTQFPYLLVLAAVAMGVVASTSTRTHEPERTSTLFCRTVLSLACLALFALNVGRIGAGFDRALATAIAQRGRTPASSQAVANLLGSSFDSDPLDSESARLWGMALADQGQRQAASGLADFALTLDPHRASCKLLQLSVRPPDSKLAVAEYENAITLDRVNYPTFYRWLAEALWSQGQVSQALEVLRRQAVVYSPAALSELFSFRESDLEDQLIEFRVLKAALEEMSQPGAGEPDLRLALQHCHARPSRQERLRRYLDALSVPLGSASGHAVSDRLRLILDQLPTQQVPVSVHPTSHDP